MAEAKLTFEPVIGPREVGDADCGLLFVASPGAELRLSGLTSGAWFSVYGAARIVAGNAVAETKAGLIATVVRIDDRLIISGHDKPLDLPPTAPSPPPPRRTEFAVTARAPLTIGVMVDSQIAEEHALAVGESLVKIDAPPEARSVGLTIVGWKSGQEAKITAVTLDGEPITIGKNVARVIHPVRGADLTDSPPAELVLWRPGHIEFQI